MTTPPPAHASFDLPGAEELSAVLREVIARWHDLAVEPGDWEEAGRVLPSRHSGWRGLAENLQLINTFQWHEEDRSRAHDAGDSVLAAVKRSIDASNARRVRAVEICDAAAVELVAAAGLHAPQAPLHSESPGSIVDRLSVLELKAWHAREQRDTAADAARTDLSERVAGIEEQIADLGGCLDRLFADIAAGRLRIKLYRQVKLYRDPASGAYLSGLD